MSGDLIKEGVSFASEALKNVRAICAVKTEQLDDEVARWRPRE